MLTKSDLNDIKALLDPVEKRLSDKIDALRKSNNNNHREIIKRMDFVDMTLDKDLMSLAKRVDNLETKFVPI